MRSACPPIMYGCKFLNFSRSNSDMELIARRTVQELEGDEGQTHLDEYADASTQRGQCFLKAICQKLGFDSLGYQSLDGLLEAVGIDRDKICTYCWTPSIFIFSFFSFLTLNTEYRVMPKIVVTYGII